MQEERTTADLPPCVIVVMGVSGSGKSTLGTQLATGLGVPFIEGDCYHDAENVEKMRSGSPLDDEDRWPWLDRLGAAAGAAARDHGLVVVACSALKRAYRERLDDATQMTMLFVLLDADGDELRRRLEQRQNHYMPPSLLESQLAALERPAEGERVLALDSRLPPDRLADTVRRWLRETLTHAN